jgi:uncharacterized protein (DUF2252 family)
MRMCQAFHGELYRNAETPYDFLRGYLHIYYSIVSDHKVKYPVKKVEAVIHLIV